ncbi:16S rRNA processing protein RimM [Hydrogenimonas sp.]|nr:16S rRNA processing protein RimM [Hydrogenimonas sp.]
MNPEKIPVARIGKSVGLKGDMRLNLLSDFPEQFKPGAKFMSDRGDLVVESYNPSRGVIRFRGIESVDEAKPLTNAYLYTTKEAGEAACRLGKDEYFWYQIIGLELVEDGEKIGRISDIERLAGTDYLQVETSAALVEKGAAKRFLVPYIDRYIVGVDLKEGIVESSGAKEILEAS